MAKYQVLCWKDIPAQVKVTDDSGKRVSRTMPDRFQVMIDQVAMAEGLQGTDEYLNQWAWSEKREASGSAEEVAQAVILQLERDFDAPLT
jgi:hypothetical protein